MVSEKIKICNIPTKVGFNWSSMVSEKIKIWKV
jgi:hypothetical protein